MRRVDVIEVVRSALRAHAMGDVLLPPEAALRWTTSGGDGARSLVLPAAIGANGDALGVKVINGNPANPRRGLPRASGVILLFDRDTARIRCLMQAEHVSSTRTAAVSAVAVDLFKPDGESLAIVGAGALAAAHLRLLPEVLPRLSCVRIHDTVGARADKLVGSARRLLPACVEVAATASAGAAIEGADVVVPVTTVTTPYITYDWLEPDALVVNVSLDDCDADVFERAERIVVDDWRLVSADERRLLGRLAAAGRFVGPGDEPSAQARRIDGELGSFLVAPDEPRRGVTVVNPFGMGSGDVALACAVAVEAATRGRGVVLRV